MVKPKVKNAILIYILKSSIVGIWYVSTFIFLSLLILHLLHFIFPDISLLTDSIGNLPDLRFIILFLVIINLIGIGINNLLHFHTEDHYSHTPDEKMVLSHLVVVSIFSYFIWKSFSALHESGMVGLIIILMAFFIYLKKLIDFYVLFIFHFLSIKNTEDEKFAVDNYTFGEKYLIGFIVLGTGLIVTTVLVGMYTTSRHDAKAKLRQQFIIRKIVPNNAMHTEIIEIKGYNFGWKTDDRWRVMSKDGEIPMNYWTDIKIGVTIPLHLQEGEQSLWIEHPKDNELHNKVVRSNKAILNVSSRFVYLPAKEDVIITKIVKRLKLYIHRLHNYFQIQIDAVHI